MRGAAAHIVGVAALAVIDGVTRGVQRVFDEALQQGNLRVLLAHERVTELMRDGERAAGADGIDEERVRAVEAVDEAGAVGELRPARGLHRAADLEREFVEFLLAFVPLDAAFVQQAEQIAVGGDVVEAVVMHAGVRDVAGHQFDGLAASDVEEARVARGVELKDGRAELKALRPLRPAARRVAALHGEDGRAVGGLPGFLDAGNFLRRQLEHPLDGGDEFLRGQLVVDLDGHGLSIA